MEKLEKLKKEVKMEVNSLRSWKLKRTIVLLAEPSAVLSVARRQQNHSSTLTPDLTPSLTPDLTPEKRNNNIINNV